MPRYDFTCRECAQTFETVVPSSVAVITCAVCALVYPQQEALADRQLCYPASIQIH